MKCILIGSSRHELLPTLESFLKHWGYRVLYSAKENAFSALLDTLNPDMALLDAEFLEGSGSSLTDQLRRRVVENHLTLVHLHEPEEDPPVGLETIEHHRLEVPLDIFQLYQLTQTVLQSHPRQRLRLDIKLPGMYSVDQGPTQIGEVLTISEGGMFLKTSNLLDPGVSMDVVLPLMGMSRELELKARVLYPVAPTQQNRYLQGVGLEFIEVDEDNRELLRQFIESSFLDRIHDEAPEAELIEESNIRRLNED